MGTRTCMTTFGTLQDMSEAIADSQVGESPPDAAVIRRLAVTAFNEACGIAPVALERRATQIAGDPEFKRWVAGVR